MTNTSLPESTKSQSSFLKLSSLFMAFGLILGLGSYFYVEAQTPELINVTQAPTPRTIPTPELYDNSGSGLDEEITVVAIPPRLGENGDLKLAPEEKKQVSLRVRNGSKETLEIDTFVKDMLVSEDGSTPYPIEGEVSNRWSLASWMTVTPTHHTLAAGKIAQISVLIEVPEDALPGGHYAMVLHQPTTGPAGDDNNQQAAAGISQQTGTLIYLTVDGPINEDAFIRNLTFPKLTEFGPVPFTFDVENHSDVHIRPQTTVEIYNLFGQKVESIQIEPKNIFPYTDRAFDSSWNRTWGFGLYKAKVVTSFGSQGQVAMANTTFWLLPIKLMIAIITILLSALVVIISVRRHLIHRQEVEQKRVQELEKKVEELENSRK